MTRQSMGPPKASLPRAAGLALSLCLGVVAASTAARAACEYDKIEAFLQGRAFTLSAEDKIGLYADRVLRYFDRGELSRGEVLDSMVAWERRWPERIYEFLRITEFEETDERDACRVRFTYRFLAHSRARDKTSAGIGESTLVIAERGPNRELKIVGEWGDVLCRGVSRFKQSSC